MDADNLRAFSARNCFLTLRQQRLFSFSGFIGVIKILHGIKHTFKRFLKLSFAVGRIGNFNIDKFVGYVRFD